MYFVVTVFTTVGFGDMSAFSPAEMVFCIFTIIIGQVINVMSASDQLTVERQEQATLIQSFAEHTQLKISTANKFLQFINDTENIHRGYDREQVKMLMRQSVFPRELEGELPKALFQGELLRNQMLITGMSRKRELQVRLPLYIAL